VLVGQQVVDKENLDWKSDNSKTVKAGVQTGCSAWPLKYIVDLEPLTANCIRKLSPMETATMAVGVGLSETIADHKHAATVPDCRKL